MIQFRLARRVSRTSAITLNPTPGSGTSVLAPITELIHVKFEEISVEYDPPGTSVAPSGMKTGLLPTHSPPASKIDAWNAVPLWVKRQGPSTAKLMPASFHTPPDWTNTAPPESWSVRAASFGPPSASKSNDM